MPRTLLAAILVALTGVAVFPVIADAAGTTRPGDRRLSLSVPATIDPNQSTAFRFQLPKGVAAVDGRLLFDTKAAEVVGLAPEGKGKTFRPTPIAGGVAFGAYGLKSTAGAAALDVVLAAHKPGQLQVRLVIDAAADAAGQRIAFAHAPVLASLHVRGGSKTLAAPLASGQPVPLRSAGATKDLVGDGRMSKKDLDIVRTGWELARANNRACGPKIDAGADANGDGCVDIVDVQAVLAAQGQRQPTAAKPSGVTVAAAMTFIVNTTNDTADATPGDHICADVGGLCSFRAAVTETNWNPGPDEIDFALTGTAPVRIQLSPSNPAIIVNDGSGGVLIDGYSQPGSSPNTAANSSNAVPGVEIRGNGNSPRENGIRVTSAGNTIRGFLFDNVWRSIVLDTAGAHDNRIVGNWIGFNTNGTQASYSGDLNILVNTGAHGNFIGTPALADRNVSGRATHAIDVYGTGTNANVIQNNLLCMSPNGTASARCNTGIDHNFGPKNELIGGTGTNERNVIGPTSLQGIEYSHGWDRSLPWGTDTATTYQINHNRAIGNWVGFRANGAYDAAFRSGLNNPGGGDNGNGINIYDGSNYNTVEGNWVASVYDGIQTMAPNATGNIIRNNIIGVSPLGQAAPLTRWGINVRWATVSHLIEGNTIRNAAAGGIGLTEWNVRRIKLTQNIISDTNGPAIFLAPDPNNPAFGANGPTAAPVITSATTIFVNGTGIAGATVELYRASRAAGQSGLPVQYLRSAVVADDGTWSSPGSLQVGDIVSALQIRANDNTSGMGINVAVTFEAPPPAPIADFSWAQEAGNLSVNFTDTSTGGAPTSRTWDFGDGTTSSQQNPTKTYAAAGDYPVSLTLTNAGGSDTKTRTITVVAPPPGTLVADPFDRTRTDSWGAADTGGAYSLEGAAANFDVADGVGTINVAAPGVLRSAVLGAVSARDVDVRFRVKMSKVAAGGSEFIYAITRRNGTSAYQPKIILNANGSISAHASVVVNNAESSLGTPVVIAGLTQAPDTFLWVRAQVTGASPTTVRIKAWADGQAEPAGWQFTATNSNAAVQGQGAVGLRVYVSGAVTNTPDLFSFDDYSVSTAP